MVIYKTTNLVNKKIYIGKDKKNNPKYLGSGILLNNSIKKYGCENFKKEIIQECKSLEELNESETFWIFKLQSYKREIGYNIALGGEGGDTISNNPKKYEIGKRHSEKLKGKPSGMKGKNHSPETKEKLHLISSGENNGMYQHIYTIETLEKQRNAKIGKKHTEEQNKNQSKRQKGKHTSLKGRKNPKHSEWMKNNNPFKGKTHTDETKEKIRIVNSKPKSEEHKKKISQSLIGNIPGNIVKVEIEGIIYESLTEASEKLNVNYSTLRNRLKSKNKKFVNYKIL
jgi:group I intron endonuclease